MLKPIKPKKYIAGDTGLRFARKILERKAAEGLYDFSEAELVFALGASSEQDGVLSVLELLDTLLGMLKNGIGFRGGHSIFVYARGVLNLAENILGRGGVSEEYRCAVDVYNELRENLNSFSERTSSEELDSLREKLTETIKSLKSAKTERFTKSIGKHTNTLKTDVISAKAFGAASIGVLRMTARNPELFKSVRSNRAFLELALKCEEKQRRSSELRRRFSMLVAELSERQTEFLRRFILENGLFSEVIKAEENLDEANPKSSLEFIAKRSSESELEKFFSTFERRLNRERQSERHYSSERNKVFSSVREMREFFTSADVPQLESFAEYLKVNSAQESDIMQKALNEYIGLSRESSELLQRAVEMIGQNAEFSDYSREKLFENAEYAELFNELNSSSKENVTEKIYAENSEFVLSYGEYAVNRVRESGEFGAELRKSAEKIERVLYYEQSDGSLKADEIREIISSAGGEALKEFAEMLKEFTGTDRLSITSRALYEYIGRFELGDRLSEAEKLLKHVVRYNSDAEALAAEIESFAAKNGSFSFWSVLERSGAADKLSGLYSVGGGTFERFSEWLENQLSDYGSLSETTELIRAYSESRGLSESFERLIAEIKSEKSGAEEYEKAYAEFEQTAENILTLIENSESTLEEELALVSEKLGRFSEKDFTDKSELMRAVERVFSVLEQKNLSVERLPSELAAALKDIERLRLSEKEFVKSADFERAAENVVSVLEQREITADALPNELRAALESFVKSCERKLHRAESNERKFASSEFSDLLARRENFSDMYEGDLEFISKTLEQLKFSEKDFEHENVSNVGREINNVLDIFERLEYPTGTLPKNLELVSRSIERFKLSDTENSRNTSAEELMRCLEEPMIRFCADSAVLSELVRVSREFQRGMVNTAEIESEYENLFGSLVSSYRKNSVSFEELKTELKTLSGSYSEMTVSERLRAFERFSEQLSLSERQGMIGGERLSDVRQAVERIKRISVESLLKFADERTDGLASVYYRVSELLKNVRTAIEKNDRERLAEILSGIDKTFSEEKISENSILSEIQRLLPSAEDIEDFDGKYSREEQAAFEASLESAAENIRLVYAQSLIRNRLNIERETINSLRSELEELKIDFSKKTENAAQIERFTDNVLRSFKALKSESSAENETAGLKRLSEYLEGFGNFAGANESSDFSRGKFTRELFEAITSDVTEERLSSALFGNEIRTELVQKLSERETRENTNAENGETFRGNGADTERRFSEYQEELSKAIDGSKREPSALSKESVKELVGKISQEISGGTFERQTDEVDTYNEYEILSELEPMVYGEKEHSVNLNSVSESVISQSEQKLSDIIENHREELEKLVESEKKAVSSENAHTENGGYDRGEFSELVGKNVTGQLGSSALSEKFARELIKAISYDAEARSISKALVDGKTVFNTAGTTVFGIKQISSAAKSVAADKVLYRAVRDFYGEHTDELADFIEQKAAAYDLFYLRAGDNSEVLQENKLFRFSRDAVSRQTERAERELMIHTAKAANSPYERIYSRLAEQNERADYSGAELFYTEEYFESPRGNVSVNYAVNAGRAEKSEEVSERLSGLNGKLDDISREIAEVRKSEQEMSSRFVLKSESSILEREIKSSIERDILLAGKRHGIF